MPAPIIIVEELSKRYRLRHQANAPYATLRESLAVKARHLFAPKPASSEHVSTEEDFWALKDVSFEIQRGDVVGIIGRNGAGKSTLLKILSRITEPTAGRITLRGRVASLLEVGTGFHPELTGRENVFLNGAILGMSKAEIRSKFDEIVVFAEVEKFLDTPVKHYSSGMYVRLAFAVAAHLEPEILIVDEVLAVGDAQFQQKCLRKMGSVAGEGRTVLFVSHNMPVVQQLTKTAILLRSGTVAVAGPTPGVIASYLQQAAGGSTVIDDVTKARRRFAGLTGLVQLEQLGFEGKAVNIFAADEPIELKVRVRSSGEAARFRISLTIFRLDGTPVGSVFSDECFTVDAGATATAKLRLRDLRLSEGQYCFGIATGKGDHATGHVDYDIVMDALPFQVMAEEGENSTKAYWTPAWGAVRFPKPEAFLEHCT
jgi:lipopolysaccharide transport system ATP-binding protein